MHQYSVREVEKMLRLPRSTIRALISAGFVSPERGPRKTLRFSFQDMIVLRTAQALAEAKVPAKRITKSLKALRRQLPETMPLSGLAIGAVGARVVVRDGAGRRQAESGQYLLAFEGDPVSGSLSVIERKSLPAAASAQDHFEQALALEGEDVEASISAYRRAIDEAPARLEARVNLGRLLHEAGLLPEAEQVYRDALAACGADALLYYNLGVLLDDMKRKPEALLAYQAALREDAGFADCHYNLALLCRELNKPQEAIRHMSQYRRLVDAQVE